MSAAVKFPTPSRAALTADAIVEEIRRKLTPYLDIWQADGCTGKLGMEIDVKEGIVVGKARVAFTEHVRADHDQK